MQKLIMSARSGANSHGFHMNSMCTRAEGIGQQMIGLAAMDVQTDTKRLPIFLGAILGHQRD